jgi:uncharacterized protein YndB with AHSA1/START domain
VTRRPDPPVTARYGTVHPREDDYQLRFERHFRQPIERVWAALTDPPQLAQWFAPGEITLRLGGNVHLAFTDGEGVIDGRVTALEPPHLLEFTWTDNGKDRGVVRWELVATDHGTSFKLIHTISDTARDFGLPALSGWHMMLGRLVALLDGQPVPPLGEGQQEFHDHYVQAGVMGNLQRTEGDRHVDNAPGRTP